MQKRLLQTKEHIRELMLERIGDAIPGVKDLSTFPFVTYSIYKEDYPYFMWIWLIGNNQAITYSQIAGFTLIDECPKKLSPICGRYREDDLGNRIVVDNYSYNRETYDAATDRIITVPCQGIAVEYRFNERYDLRFKPDYFRVMEAEYAKSVDKRVKFIETYNRNDLIGFPGIIWLYGFPLESDCKYYKHLLNGVDTSDLKTVYESTGTKFYPVKFNNGVDYSQKSFQYYCKVIERIQSFVHRDSLRQHNSINDSSELYKFPKFKDMNDLLKRRDELFGCPMSDDDVKNFIKDYMRRVFTIGGSIYTPIGISAIISGYDTNNEPQFKLLKDSFYDRAFNSIEAIDYTYDDHLEELLPDTDRFDRFEYQRDNCDSVDDVVTQLNHITPQEPEPRVFISL